MCNARKRLELELRLDEVRKEKLIANENATIALDNFDIELSYYYEDKLDSLIELEAKLMKELELVNAEIWK